MPARLSFFQRIVRGFNSRFQQMLEKYVFAVNRSILRPVATTLGILGMVLLGFALLPLLGRSYFPRTDPVSSSLTLNVPAALALN